ncbi:LysM peptidoglycan-binding domain-containing protein [Variovorax boronicumulans]|uniref:LysM peptidoglycan-binding domain-containing protein n=1 Tax=Variovorax boronicumulans TaxID=436515 RepID=UPI002788267D|nr:LysM peptidoglycan-binding domain-containing protein [Variovorax boronicumulans]MDQ0045676.1 YD repeat-containing protein [Variovorax boronicumulans]
MVAIVSGNSLGLSLTSLATLGQRGTHGAAGQGRNGEQAFVNISNGNLVLQDFDDKLVGRGLDVNAVRTYNSQGLLNDDNGDNWVVGAYGQSVKLSSGTLAAAGSTLVRTDRDGAAATYTWDVARSLYVSSAGAGAFDTIAYDSTAQRLNWADGDTGLQESYESTALGRLLLAKDPAGNTLSYTYNAGGPLQKIVDANGETTYFDYTGTNLTQIRTEAAGGAILTRVRYAYDTSNRLSSVTVDLSPEDNVVTDAKTYVTTYTYDGTSKRIASVTQSDGTSLAFTYGADNRIATVKDGLGQITSYTYDTANRRTTVTDPLGLTTFYSYDTTGQLTQIQAPAVGGVSQITLFSYDANGNVTQVTDPLLFTVTMQYDAYGNQTLQRDAAGNTITRTFDARNQLLTETVYLTPDPDGSGTGQPSQPLTTRFVYDGTGKNQLRFVLSAEGRVTEYRYDSYGQRTTALQYASGRYDVSTLAVTAVPTEAQLVTWTGTQDRTQASRTDTVYDARGQIQKITAFGTVDVNGNGVVDSTQSVTQYVYDRAGLLLSTISATTGTTAFTYDGKGRQLSSLNALNQTTLTSYDDANNKTVVTLANGLITTSAYDKNGRLTSVTQGSATTPNLGATTSSYDKDGRLIGQVDPTGVATGRVYDEAGRLIAEIGGNNTLTEYVYNKNNQVTQKIVYATPATAAAVAAYYADPNSTLVNRLGALRPGLTNNDQKSWRIYDGAGRLMRTVDSAGAVTDFRYDGAARLIGTTQYLKALLPATLDALGAAPTFTATAPGLDGNDRITRRFYDNDGLLLGTLDAEGYLTESRYDAKGRLITQISYAGPTTGTLRAAGTLAQLIPAADAQDQTSRWIYDDQGRVLAQIDAEGYMTEYVYDGNGNVTTSTRYATPVSATLLSQMTTATTVTSLRPATAGGFRTTTSVYDKLNRLTQRTNFEGTVFTYEYDSVGNLVKTTSAVGTAEIRTINARYDIQGRLTGELTAVGGALLVAGQTQAQIDAIWSQYGLTHAYDTAGRRISTTDAYSNKALFYYDADGRLTHTVNALGEVTEQHYNGLGQLDHSTRYGTRFPSVTGLTGGLVTEAFTTSVAALKNVLLDSTQSFTYNVTGQVATATDEKGNVTQSTYNAFGDLTTRTLALGGGQQLVQSMTVDRRGLVTSTVSDAAGLNAITSAVYDAFGRLTSSTDANFNLRQQRYDRLGRTVGTIDAVLGVRSSTYDAFDRVLTQTDALNQVTTFTYDKALRSVAIKTPENITVTTVYTRHGQKQSVVDGNLNTTTYAYDKDGHLLSTTTALTSTSSTYDRAGRLATTKDANGTIVTLAYDAANRVLTRTVDATGLNLITIYAYDPKGQQYTVTDPNGVVTTIAYDLKGQVTSRTVDATGLNLVTQYTYDGVGNTLTVVDPNLVTTQYIYDKLGRRTQMRVDPAGLNLTTSYAYDKSGNLTSKTDPNLQVTRYAYDAENRLVFTLDPVGNLQRTKYDTEGRVVLTIDYAAPIDTTGLGAAPTPAQIEAKVGAIANPAKDITVHRVLDKDGRLAATVNGLGEVVKFVYDANGNVIDRTAYVNRITLASWTVGSVPAPTADTTRDLRLRTVYDQLNRATYTIDGVGAVTRAIYDANGNVVERLAYATPVPIATVATASALAAAIQLATNPQQAGTNLFTQSEFANGVIDAPARGGAITATTMTGLGGAIRVDKDPSVITYAYKTLTPPPVPGVSYTLSVIVEMEDGLPPSFGSASVTTAANSFGLALFMGATNPLKYVVQDMGGGRYRVSVTGVAPPAASSYFGVLKYTGNDARAFRVSGFQVEQADVASRYTVTTTAAVVQVASGVRERFVYDRANRLTWRADGVGAVTQLAYDKNGNVLKTIQYATAISGSAGLSTVPVTTGDRITDFTYDRANRQTFTTDALGTLTETIYDKNGNVTTRYAFAKSVAVPTTTSKLTDAQVRLARVYDYAGADRVTRAAYDAANRLVLAVDATGAMVETSYDAAGNAIKSVSYAKPIVLTSLQTNLTANYATLKALLTVDTANDRTVKRTYDGANRLVYTVDPMGFVSKNAYDGVGRVTQTVSYWLSIPAATANTTSAIGLAIVLQPTLDRTNSFGYDAAGRLLSTTDPLNYTESYTYNGLGQKVTFTNKKSSVWSYQYDTAGRVIKETAPAVEVTAVKLDANGTLIVDAANSSTVGIVTQMTYDALGNLKSRTEAAGRVEQRVTSYEYDAVGHQVRTIFPTVNVYNAAGDTLTTNGAGGLASRTEVATTLETRTTYDVFGNAITNRDVAGSYSYKTYDVLGRVKYDVDALGFVTGYIYDVWGKVTELTRFANATTLAASTPASLSAAQVTTAVNAAGLDHGPDRKITTTFDRAGRVTKVVEPQTYTYDSSAPAASQYASAGRTTVNTYNAFGDITRVGLQKNATQNTWVYTNNYYNLDGQQVASVDALGYLTTQSFDAFGNVSVRTEYAKAVASWNAASAPVTPPTTTVDAINDRKTSYVYDRMGRKLSETRASVEYSASTNGTSARADLVTSYAYDAVGNLTRTTDAAGGTTYSYYDALGRVRATASPSSANGNLTAVTKFQRDAYGNVVVKTETHVYKSSAAADALVAPGATSLVPGQTLALGQSIYSADGRYTFTLQSNGNLVVLDRHDNNQVLWNSQTVGSGATSFVFQADGNLVLSGPNGTIWNAGTNAKGGVNLVMQGDGNLVLYTSAGAAVWTTGADNNSGINADRLTYTQYDKLGHATQSTDAAGFNHYSSYDARGNVAKEWQLVTDGSNVSSTLFRAYQYDKLGQQTHIIDPASRSQVSGSTVTTVTQAQAGLVDTALEYNGFGEVTRKGVNGGRQEYFNYDNAGRIWRTNSGDGVDKVALYDLLGNQTANITSYGKASNDVNLLSSFSTPDAVAAADLRRTDMVYDLLGRLSSTIAPQRNDATGGAQVSRLFTQGTITGSSSPTRDESGIANGSVGTNVVNLSWSALRNLGSGDIKVVMEYMTKSYPVTPISLDGNGNPITTDESGQPLPPPQMVAGQLRSRTQTVANLAENINSLTMRWDDPASDANGGVGRITKIAIYKKDTYGNWQPVITEGTVGYSGQVIDFDAPTDPSSTMRLQIRAAGSTGENGWSDAPLVNFGDMLRYNASSLPPGSYEYRVTQTTSAGGATVTARGTVALTSPPLATISVPLGFYQTSLTTLGLFTWSSPGTSVEQTFRFRPAGSNGGWTTVAVSDRGNGRDGVELSLIAAGNYEYELLWSRAGEGVPYAHATGPLSSTGWVLPKWVPPVNLPVITGVSIKMVGSGGNDESGNPIGTSTPTIQWPYSTTINAGNAVTFRYRAQGSTGAWSTLTITSTAGSNESNLPIGTQSVSVASLSPGLYDFQILATYTSQGTTQSVAQATGVLDNRNTPIMETRSGVNVFPYQVQVGTTPIYARDESGNIIYETVNETQYQTQQVPVWGWVQVPRVEEYQVAVQGPPMIAGYDESNNPIYVRDMWGNIQYQTVNETRYRTVIYDVWTIVGWQPQTVPVQVPVQRPVITGYQPVYEWRYNYVPYSYQVQVGTTPTTVQDNTPPYTPGYLTPTLPPLFSSQNTTGAGTAAASENNTDGAAAVQTPTVQGASTATRPVVNKNVDRWGNVISISDPRSAAWVTTYRYNANNQLIEQKQPDANGAQNTAGAATTQLFYDKLGRQVAVKDANGNVQGQAYDARGNLIQELHADGGVINNSYNVFGEKVGTVDAMGRSTSFTYDNLGRLLTTTRMAANVWGWASPFGPSVISTGVIIESNAWDQAGRKLSQTNGAGEILRYAYDLRGNVISTTQDMGQVTRAAFDSMNRKIGELDANGALSTWSYNYFGQVTAHRDIGGATYSYTYDNARQLTLQTNSRGQNLKYSYDKAGQLLRIDDAAVGKVTTYAYDLAGRHVRETTTQGGVTYQDNQMAYDALGRLRWVADTNAYITIDYDKVGNRTHIHTKLAYSGVSSLDGPIEQAEESDRYFAYDQMNRQTLVDSATADGSVLGTEGHKLRYDQNGNRTRDEYTGVRIVQQNGQWTAVGGNIVEDYSYDNLNRLSTTVRDGALVESRGYDGASRVISSTPGGLGVDYVNLHRQYRGINGTDALQGRSSQYDRNGRLIHQATTEYMVSASAVNYTYDNEGNALSYLVADTLNGTFTNTANTVERAEGYRTLTSLSVTTKAATGTLVSQGVLGYNYDANGHLRSTGDVGQTAQPDLRTHNFINDANGNALYAYYAYEGTPDKRVNGQRQMVVNGEVLGRYGLLTDNRFDGSPLAPKGPIFTPQSDFSFGYQPINGNYPTGTPGSYSVGVSDTLETIAKGAYGDSSLWYLIADANGLSSNADLRAGQVLRIPAATSSANNVNTFKPYDPSKIANDSPTMMAMPQAEGGGCGVIGQIIMVVVAVVVTIYTAGAAGAYFGAAGAAGGGGFAGGMAVLGGASGVSAAGIGAAAVGGAVGSIASQAVGIAIGAQDSFSWKGVALGAIGAGVSAGVGAALGPVTSTGLDRAMAFAGRGALTGAVTQGISVATGLQSSFSWRGVAASAVGAGVGSAVGDVVGPVFGDSSFGQFATRATSGFAAGMTAAAMRGGRVSVTQVATDAFGNALGDSIAAANSSSGSTYVSQEEKLRDQFWAQSLGPVESRSRSAITSAAYDQLVGAFGQPGSAVDRSNDVLLADNWARDPSQNRVLSDAGAGRGRGIDVRRVDSQSPAFRVEVSGVGTPDEYNAAQVQRAYEKGEDLKPTRANAERLELQRTTITEDEAYSLAATSAGGDAILSSGMPLGVASGAGNSIVRSIAESASDAIIDYRLGPRTMGAVGTVISGYGVAAGYATGNPLLAGISWDQMHANAKLTVFGEPQQTYVNKGLQDALGLTTSQAAIGELFLTGGAAAAPSVVKLVSRGINNFGNAVSDNIEATLAPYTIAGRSMEKTVVIPVLEDWSHLTLSQRHLLGKLTVPKATGNSLFTGDRADAFADVAEIRLGLAVREGQEFSTSSGRIWGMHDTSLHPISGPNVINISSQEYKVLAQAQKQGGDRALMTLENLASKNILDSDQVARTKSLIEIINQKRW